MQGTTTKVVTGSGDVYITVNLREGEPFEVFAVLGRAGSEERALTEAIGRVISTALQGGIPAKKLARQLRGISSENVIGLGPNKVLSVPDAVGQVLQTY